MLNSSSRDCKKSKITRVAHILFKHDSPTRDRDSGKVARVSHEGKGLY